MGLLDEGTEEGAFSFEDSLRERFGEKGLTATPDEATEGILDEAELEVDETTEEEPEERERDERGRFVSKQQEETDEDPEEVESELEQEVDRLFAGKYKSADELERAYQELQQKLGDQGAELGELRNLRREIEELRNDLYEDGDPDDFSDFAIVDSRHSATINTLLEQERYVEAAAVALRADPSENEYRRVMEQWVEVQPFAAMDFSTRYQTAKVERDLRAELAGTQAVHHRQAAQDAFKGAWKSVSDEHPDLGDYAEEMLEAAKMAPSVARVLEQGTPQAMKQTIEALYYMTKGRQADTLSSAAEEAAQTVSENKTAKRKAAVASASSSPSARGKKSGTDRFKEQIMEAPLTSIDVGLDWKD